MALTPEQIIAEFMLRERQLAAIVADTEYVPSALRDMNLTTFVGSTTTEVRIRRTKDKALALVPTTERGAPIPQDLPRGEDMRILPTYRLAKGMTLYAEELQDIVTFGEGSARVRAVTEVQRRVQELEQDMALTEEFMLHGIVQGKMLDSDGTVLHDYFTEWGIAPNAPVTFDFATETLRSFLLKCSKLKRDMGIALKGRPWTGRIKAMMGHDAYEALAFADILHELYVADQRARESVNRGQPYSSFQFAGIEWMDYRGTDDQSTVAIPPNEIRFFPEGARGMFLDVRGPGESFEHVNQRGRPRYLMQVRDRDRNMWLKNEVYTYPNYVCTQPGALFAGTVA